MSTTRLLRGQVLNKVLQLSGFAIIRNSIRDLRGLSGATILAVARRRQNTYELSCPTNGIISTLRNVLVFVSVLPLYIYMHVSICSQTANSCIHTSSEPLFWDPLTLKT